MPAPSRPRAPHSMRGRESASDSKDVQSAGQRGSRGTSPPRSGARSHPPPRSTSDRRHRGRARAQRARASLRRFAQAGRTLVSRDPRPARERRERVGRALQPFGYYRPVVMSSHHSGTRWKAKYVIQPGPPLRVDSLDVRVTGEGPRTSRSVRPVAEFPLREGDVLVHFAVRARARTRFQPRRSRTDTRPRASAVHEMLESISALHLDGRDPLRDGPRVSLRSGRVRAAGRESGAAPGLREVRARRSARLQPRVELEQRSAQPVLQPHRGAAAARPRDWSELPIVVDLVPSNRASTRSASATARQRSHAKATVELRASPPRASRWRRGDDLDDWEQGSPANYAIPWPYPRTDVVTLTAGYESRRPRRPRAHPPLGAGLARLWCRMAAELRAPVPRERWASVSTARGRASSCPR